RRECPLEAVFLSYAATARSLAGRPILNFENFPPAEARPTRPPSSATRTRTRSMPAPRPASVVTRSAGARPGRQLRAILCVAAARVSGDTVRGRETGPENEGHRLSGIERRRLRGRNEPTLDGYFLDALEL